MKNKQLSFSIKTFQYYLIFSLTTRKYNDILDKLQYEQPRTGNVSALVHMLLQFVPVSKTLQSLSNDIASLMRFLVSYNILIPGYTSNRFIAQIQSLIVILQRRILQFIMINKRRKLIG